MRTYYVVQGTIHRKGVPKRRGNKKGGDMCICIDDSRCHMVETKTHLNVNFQKIERSD